jgi:hypothetical protein
VGDVRLSDDTLIVGLSEGLQGSSLNAEGIAVVRPEASE